ncbi:MAG TPA: hypothetical protein VLH83_03725 [Chthoniobacterales bacterium]|nr:hypothetical protein [Chthoniobacterales bacterium]
MWLRFLSATALCALFSCCFSFAHAQPARTKLHGGRSPDGRFAVGLQSEPAKNGGAILSYVVIDEKNGATLLRLKSSYSTNVADDDEVPGRWLDLAKATDVYWNQDSLLVAIDEGPLQHSGHVFLAAIDGNHTARRLIFPEKEILRRTGFVWARVRLRVRADGSASWTDNHHLCVNVGGFPSPESGKAAPAGGFPNRTFHAVIEVEPRSRPRVVSVQPALEANR